MSEKEMSFEEALEMLEKNVELLRSDKLNLVECAKVYEEANKYYETCSRLLTEVKQKIEIYRPESGITEDFNEQ